MNNNAICDSIRNNTNNILKAINVPAQDREKYALVIKRVLSENDLSTNQNDIRTKIEQVIPSFTSFSGSYFNMISEIFKISDQVPSDNYNEVITVLLENPNASTEEKIRILTQINKHTAHKGVLSTTKDIAKVIMGGAVIVSGTVVAAKATTEAITAIKEIEVTKIAEGAKLGRYKCTTDTINDVTSTIGGVIKSMCSSGSIFGLLLSSIKH